jgi:hypothetical protein
MDAMETLTCGGHLAAPVERVFDLAIDAACTQAAMPGIEDVWDVRGRQDKVGDRVFLDLGRQ